MLTQKIKYLFSGLVLGSMLTSAIAFAGSPIKLIVNGNQLHTDVPPQIINGRTMIPARPLAEALDANVDWDQTLKLISKGVSPAFILIIHNFLKSLRLFLLPARISSGIMIRAFLEFRG